VINKSGALAVHPEICTRSPVDVATRSDIGMMSSTVECRFVRKDGTPYS
jgi:hypothetical protein